MNERRDHERWEWEVGLLGGLSARRAGDRDRGGVTRFRTQRVASLLACLAHGLGRAHPREVLIEMLWPGSDVAARRNGLSVALSSLRGQFEPPGVAHGTVVRADRFSVGLNPASVTTDVARFEAALAAAAGAASGTERAQHLADALALYRGPLLPGYYEPWVAPEQERLAGLFFDAAAALVAHLEAAGDLTEALAHARRAVAVDPLREEGQHHLIRLLAAAVQPGAALRQYREFERLLEEEIGDEPSAALRSLYRRVERDSGPAAAPVAGGVPPAPPQPAPAPAPGNAGGPATVTILATDLVPDAADAERPRGKARDALAITARERHHAILRAQVVRYGGQEVRDTGDGMVAAFPGAGSALACAAAVQSELAATAAEEGPPGGDRDGFAVRMALHSGDVERDAAGHLRGAALRVARRILAAGHGGQVLVSETTAGLVSAAADAGGDEGVRLADLGVYRLPEAPEPRRLFQAEWPGMARRDFGPLAAEAGHAPRLPPRFTRFFGREREIARVGEMLLAPDVRLVTVSGPGGTGKTRLALEVAERLAEAFNGAAYYVPLADVSDAAFVGGAILDGLGVPRSAAREPLAQAGAALARRPALLVLDNLEHLAEGGAADAVRSLLEAAPSLTILVTSRVLLGFSAEREFPLGPLEVPPAAARDQGGDLEAVSLYESVQLFVDRARQARTDFRVADHNAAAIAALVAGLEGIPLAIELAAARALVMTPAQMLDQLASRRFDLLTTRRRDVAERQRTLGGTIDWSYRLLSPGLQRFFCRLSVFRGGWTAEAAEVVCEEPLALDYLTQLREASLVLTEEGTDGGGGMRFRMLETLREFAWEHLAEEEKAANRRRHAQYFGRQVEERQKDGSLWEYFEQWAQGEHENLRQAIAWSLDSPADADLAGSLVYMLAYYRDCYGYYAENLRDLERALERAERMSPRVRCYTRYFHAWLFERKGMWNWITGAADRERSLELMAEVLEMAREAGETRVQAMALNKLGRDDEALPLFEKIGDRWGIATALKDTAFRIYKSDPSAAEALYARVLAINREDNNTLSIIHTLDQMGIARESVGDLAGARAAFEEGLRLYGPHGAPDGLAFILPHVARIALHQGDHCAACAYAERLLALRWPAGETERRTESLRFAVMTFRDAGEAEAARRLLEQYLAQSRAEGDERGMTWALGVLAEMGG